MASVGTMMASRRAIVEHFRDSGATSVASAIAYDPAPGAELRQFERLRADQIIRQDNRGGFFLDFDKLGDWREKRLSQGATAAAAGLAVAGAVAVFALFRFRKR